MSVGTLYTAGPIQMKGHIIKAVAAYGGLTLDEPTSYTHYETNKAPEFLAKFPHGKVPAFEGADGVKLFEGIPIALYLASLAPNSGLLGTTPIEAAEVNQWIHLVESELEMPNTIIKIMSVGKIPYTKPTQTFFTEFSTRTLGSLEAHLKTHTYLVGERITVADIAVAGLVANAATISIDAELRAKHPQVFRLVDTIFNNSKLKSVFPEVKYVDKAITFVPPPKEKKAAPPKEEKKAEKPKKKEVEEEEEEEEAVPAEPKAKNPLDDLPKSTLNLEDWKRAYSNKDTRGAGGAIEWFYENYDKEGFSVWRVDFKYNSELTQTFMSSNQIGGFFNRLEASRKYLFGSVGVLGSANDSVIAGTLILRGKDVVPVVNVAPDWESYEYKPLDLENEDDKKFFEGALAWDLEIDGKAWVDGKNFK